MEITRAYIKDKNLMKSNFITTDKSNVIYDVKKEVFLKTDCVDGCAGRRDGGVRESGNTIFSRRSVCWGVERNERSV